MSVPLNTPLPVLPEDPQVVAQFIVWRLQRLRPGRGLECTATTPFIRLGIDSLEAITLVGELEHGLGRDVSPEVIFEHPTPIALAAFLVAEHHRAPGTGP